MIISDKSLGLVESIPDFYPKATWQRCVVHYYRNVFSLVPHGRRKEVAAMLKAIHAQENLHEAKKKKDQIAEKPENMKLGKASELVRSGSQKPDKIPPLQAQWKISFAAWKADKKP